MQEAGVDEAGDVAVERRLRDVAQHVFELLGREPAADECLHDAEAHRVQERVGGPAVTAAVVSHPGSAEPTSGRLTLIIGNDITESDYSHLREQ